jgi:FkbM family methyltransferase
MGIQDTAHLKLAASEPANCHSGVDFEHDIVANEYGFYCVPAEFRGREVPEILARGEVYEPATLGLMSRILQRGGDVVTGGTFIGDFLPALSGALTPGAQLHTFEPNPVALEAAKFTRTLNGLDNVVIHACAVGEKAGKLHLQVAKPNGASMAARAKIVPTATKGETITTPVKKLDELVGKDRDVSLIHLDIEGHEWPAILGARKLIRAHAPCILVEAEKGWKRRRIESGLNEHFPEAGYRFVGCIERNSIFMPLTSCGPFRAV